MQHIATISYVHLCVSLISLQLDNWTTKKAFIPEKNIVILPEN